MPHFGLMDEQELGPVASLLQRARLHVRSGKRRLREGKAAEGIATLYDALSAAMRWRVASAEPQGSITIEPARDANDDRSLHAALARSGVLDAKFDFDAFARLTEQALHGDLPGNGYADVLAGYEAAMTQLGVMPFDEASLPPEDPRTY